MWAHTLWAICFSAEDVTRHLHLTGPARCPVLPQAVGPFDIPTDSEHRTSLDEQNAKEQSGKSIV